MEGNYTCEASVLKEIRKNKQIVFTYSGENPNGSMQNIAGVCNQARNVLGMMPHPERVMEKTLGGIDGLPVFESIKNYLKSGKKKLDF